MSWKSKRGTHMYFSNIQPCKFRINKIIGVQNVDRAFKFYKIGDF